MILIRVEGVKYYNRKTGQELKTDATVLSAEHFVAEFGEYPKEINGYPVLGWIQQGAVVGEPDHARIYSGEKLCKILSNKH
tara:strand:+ start:220 stop:462 length:243 start_codon:yes stop_codon:yes gene_type:complete